MTGLDWLPSTVGQAEIVWTLLTAVGTLVGAIGAGITTTNLQAALRAHRRACERAPVNRLHTMITATAVRNEAISVIGLVLLLAMLALFVGVGLFALASPDPIREELSAVDRVTTLVLIAGAGIATAASLGMTLGSVLNRRDRHRMTNLITGNILAELIARREQQRGEP